MVSEKVRRLMGYRVKPKDKSVMIYSRDALAEGLETLTGIIGNIRELSFRPDAPRNQRWKSAAAPSVRHGPSGVVLGDEGDADVPLVGEAELDMIGAPTPDKKMRKIMSMEDLSSESEESEEDGGEVQTNETWRP